MPYYLNITKPGVILVSSKGDGDTITVNWSRAFPDKISNLVAYNIYMDVVRPDFEHTFFNKNPVFISTDGKLSADIIGLVPGQMYRFGVRAVEYDPVSEFDLRTLPIVMPGLQVYPESPLRADITATSSIVPLLSVAEFPATGVVKVGVELIQYSSLDTVNDNLVLTNVGLQRGFHDTTPTFHDTDGYDGYAIWDTNVLFFPIDVEESNTVVFATQDRFDVDNYAFTVVDGYRQTTHDITNADMTVSDIVNENFPAYSYAGWHRTDPVALLNGECVGSYFGGEQYCADGYDGVGRVLRGISVDDTNTQRQEVLLSLIGEPVCLVKRQVTGIRCSCILATSEMPDARCHRCYGGGFVVSYNQYFDSRNSDGRIRARFEPWVDSLPLSDAGLSVQEVKPGAWTLVLPAIRTRDFLVRFDKDGNEEFRYEVVNVSRNILFGQQFGAQKLSLQRIRKTDIIYMVPVFRDTSTMPTTIQTTITSSLGIPPHAHSVVKSERHPMFWQQLTSNSASHNHIVRWDPIEGILVVSTELGHTHQLLY